MRALVLVMGAINDQRLRTFQSSHRDSLHAFSVACSSKDYLLEKAFISERRTKAREPSEVAVWVTGKALTACAFERENGKMER